MWAGADAMPSSGPASKQVPPVADLACLPMPRCAHHLSPGVVRVKPTARLEARHALGLELLDPRGRARLRLVRLVVLVEHHANELAVAGRLGLDVVVVVSADHADDLGALLGEAVVELARGVAEVVGVARRVADAAH